MCQNFHIYLSFGFLKKENFLDDTQNQNSNLSSQQIYDNKLHVEYQKYQVN
jgi:hypothetical protein